ncbi:MAG: Lrp/AsnC family transcriptional regulator [Ruminococcaceae bacterium]|nr:Lrp/AsnC family transcriptional regulator [Oscillospiraceae bacterium]
MAEIKNAKKLVDILHKNCKLSLEQVATMADMTVPEVAAAIDALEANGTILGYGAVINWDKIQGKETVTAYIELQVSPQRHKGFNRLAERIYQFPEVKSLNLMSGNYDFGITVEASSIQEIAMFVSERLAPMESVLDTATHFVLKRYKSDGVIYDVPTDDDREVISL